jgi:hypothetical protein
MDNPRIWRSHLSRFGNFTKELDVLNENETITANKAYTDEELSKISESGFNAIWVHGLLRNIVKSEVFPEFGKNAIVHQKNMNELIRRAAKYNIKVFIYMQPPRAIWSGADFWKQHHNLAGSTETLTHEGEELEVKCLCTSTSKVKKYLKTSAATLAKKLPGLGGIIMITASEYPAHCWSRRGLIADAFGHYNQIEIECPRCAKRKPGDVVNELIQLIRDGMRSVSNEMKIICWNWSWTAYEKDPSPTIIAKLPKDVIYMADFERGDEKLILGKKRKIDEYSLSFSGPSKRFVDSTKLAKKLGLKTAAKLQFGTTHELATVPNIPLIGNIYNKVKYLRENGINAFMGCWNFGNMITANTTAFNHFLTCENLKKKKNALSEFATKYFQNCDAKLAGEAWLIFSTAMDSYPFSIPFLYASPINYTLSYSIKASQADKIPCGGSWFMEPIRGDCLDKSLEGYTLDEVIKGFDIIHRKWKIGLDLFEKALENSNGIHKAEEISTARTCYHVFRSVWNTYRAYKLRKNWKDKNLLPFLMIVKDELENLQEVLPIIKNDSRQGFHGEAFDYMFNAKSISKKIKQLKSYSAT